MGERVESAPRRRNRLLLLLALGVSPLLALADRLIAPQAFEKTLAVRLAYAGLMALALALSRRIPDRAQTALLFFACQLAALASGVVMILERDLTALFALGAFPLAVAMFVPLTRRQALAMHGGMALWMNLLPFEVLVAGDAHPALAHAGLATGLAAAGLAMVIHVGNERSRKGQEEALAELDRENTDLTSMLSRERGRVAALASALGEISRVLAAIDASAATLEEEARALGAVADLAERSAREAVEGSTQMGQTAAAMDEALLSGRERVEAHVRFEKEAALPARETIVRDAAELASAVLEIGESARQVTEIAQETRLLALNAGLAAMRQGGAGGLYVVSSGLGELSEAAEAGARKLRDRVLEVLRAAQLLDRTVAGHATLAGLSAVESSEVLDGVREVAVSIGRIREAVRTLAGASELQSNTAASLATLSKELARSAAGLRSAAADLRAQTDLLWLDAARAA
jgi:methyl-accepting chemotaxis protein